MHRVWVACVFYTYWFFAVVVLPSPSSLLKLPNVLIRSFNLVETKRVFLMQQHVATTSCEKNRPGAISMSPQRHKPFGSEPVNQI